MEETGNKLADYMISGYFFYGRYRMKKILTVVHFVVFTFILIFVITDWLPVNLRVCLIIPLLIGIVISIYALMWSMRAIRVSQAVRRLKKHGDYSEALQELVKDGRLEFEKRDVVFGSRFAFFFPSGVVLSYRDITRLRIVTDYNKPHTKSMPKKNVLWARLSDGKWLPIIHTRLVFPYTTSLKTLRNYAAELMNRNATITLV